MIKVIAGFKRKTGLTLDEFSTYYFERHAPLFRRWCPTRSQTGSSTTCRTTRAARVGDDRAPLRLRHRDGLPRRRRDAALGGVVREATGRCCATTRRASWTSPAASSSSRTSAAPPRWLMPRLRVSGGEI